VTTPALTLVEPLRENRPSNAEYARMFQRIKTRDTEFVQHANRAQEVVVMKFHATAFPSHDDLFSYTEIAASFDDVATYDGWAVEE